MNYLIEKHVPLEWEPGDVILNLYEVKTVTLRSETSNKEYPYHEGGFGRVYKVWHRAWNLHMAVKTPKPGMFSNCAQKDLFFKECETWINLGLHPHVAACHYVRELGGLPRVFSEYADNGTLAEWIASKQLYKGDNKQVLTRILGFAIQLAWGLHHSHENGVIHQDVKPSNALIFGEDLLKVCDFGIAGVKASPSFNRTSPNSDYISASIVENRSRALTLEYCSPEQYEGRELSRKTDIWSWGLSVLEMFIGDVSWISGTTAQEVLDHYLENSDTERPNVQMPNKLVNLLRSCFERDPSLRPATSQECACITNSIYQQIIQSEYFRNQPAAVISTPALLNNRGLSLIDLGNTGEALEVLHQAVKSDSSDKESIYNLGLLRWRTQEISDNQFLESLTSSGLKTDNLLDSRLELGLANYELGFFMNASNYLAETSGKNYKSQIATQYYHKSIFRLESNNNQQINIKSGRIRDLVISNDSKKVLVLCDKVVCYDFVEDTLVEFEQSKGNSITHVKFRPNADVAFGAAGNSLIFWNTDSGNIFHEIKTEGRIYAVFPQITSDTIIMNVVHDSNGHSRESNARIELIDLRTGATIKKYSKAEYGYFLNWASSDGRRLISSGINSSDFSSGDTCIWDLSDDNYIHYSKSSIGSLNILYLYSNLLTFLATVPDQAGLSIMDTASGLTIASFGQGLGFVESVMVSNDEILAVICSRLRISGSYVYQWVIYDLVQTRVVRKLHRGMPSNIWGGPKDCNTRIAPNGKFVIWVSQADTIQILHIGNYGGAPYILKRPEEYATIWARSERHNQLITQAKIELEQGNYPIVANIIRESRKIVGNESNPEAVMIWDSLLSVMNPIGVLEMRENLLLLSDDCGIVDHNFGGAIGFGSASSEVIAGVETIYDRSRGRENAAVVCWYAKINRCRVIVESLPKMREIQAIAVLGSDMERKIFCANGRFILGYNDKGLQVYKIDRGKFQYRDPDSVSIDIASCGTLVACGIKKSWRDEARRPLEMLPVEVWTIPGGERIPVRLHPQTESITGIEFLQGAASTLIFGCNLGIQICNLLTGQFSVFGGELGEVDLFDVSPCGTFVAAVYQNGKVNNVIVVWRIGNLELSEFSIMADARVIDVKFAPGTKLLIVYLENGMLQFHSMDTLECGYEKLVVGDRIGLSPDGTMLFVTGFGAIAGFKVTWDY